LNKKKELYSIFYGQEFCLPNANEKEPPIKNSIILLEEFDYAIDALVQIEDMWDYKKINRKNYLKKKTDEIKGRTQELIEITQEREDHKRDTEEELKKKLTKLRKPNGEIDFQAYMNAELLEDGIDMENNRVHEKARYNILQKRDYDNEQCMVNTELNNIIKNIDDDNKSDILRISDLLELFQGPVPIKNRIVVATTNNFDRIKNVMPALFRSGRLTSIHMDFLDWASLNELCMYYFQKNMTYEAVEITVPTSQIIELAVKHVLTTRDFDAFEDELIDLLIGPSAEPSAEVDAEADAEPVAGPDVGQNEDAGP
jgi:hypothetical protein